VSPVLGHVLLVDGPRLVALSIKLIRENGTVVVSGTDMSTSIGFVHYFEDRTSQWISELLGLDDVVEHVPDEVVDTLVS
jgi:hypothetical protein